MEVIWIESKRRFFAWVPACRHFEFDVFMSDVLLLEIHPVGLGVGSVQVSTPWRSPQKVGNSEGVDRIDAPDDSHQLTPNDRITPIRANT